jgi:hypothetical protein
MVSYAVVAEATAEINLKGTSNVLRRKEKLLDCIFL